MATDQKKNADFLKQGGILAMASLFVRFIGLIYRIPMSNILGEEGNGIYAVAFEIYDLILIISSYSLPLALSKIISAQVAKREYKNSGQTLRVGLMFAAISGGVFGGFLLFGAEFIEKHIYPEYAGVHIPLRVLAPTILIVAFLGVFRGFFQGKRTMMPTAISQVIEQVINAIVSVLASYLFMKWTIGDPLQAAWGAAGGTLGTCLGAAAALLLLLFLSSIYRPVQRKLEKKDRSGRVDSTGYLFRVLLLTIFPVILSQTVYNISGLIDYKLFGYLSANKGIGTVEIKSLVGVYSSKYRVMCSVPIALSTALASSMIPSAVAAFTQGDIKQLKSNIASVVKFNMIIAFPCFIGYTVLGLPIIRMLFSSNYILGGKLLVAGSLAIVFYALSNVTGGALQSINKMSLPVFHSALSLILHVGIVYICIKFTPLGIYSLIVGNITFPMVVWLLNLWALNRHIPGGYKQEWIKTFVAPLAASLWMGSFTLVFYEIIGLITNSNLIRTLISLFIAMIVYFIALLVLNTLTKEELVEFPCGYRLYALAKKVKLMS
ncbi:MAG: polysaccharide biosynthesis protein [Eubacterium sp.]|nr:polysaccharide biosynthesis protein [Eubacterium sp.]